MKAIEAIDPAMERWFSDNGWSNSRVITYDHQGLPLGRMTSSVHPWQFLRLGSHQYVTLKEEVRAGNELRQQTTDMSETHAKYGKKGTIMGW